MERKIVVKKFTSPRKIVVKKVIQKRNIKLQKKSINVTKEAKWDEIEGDQKDVSLSGFTNDLNSDDIPQGSTNLYDKTVSLQAGTGIEITGTYPSFTIKNISEGIKDHSALDNLDYEHSGHTGFASTIDLNKKLDRPENFNLDTETLTLSTSYIHSFKKVGNRLFGGSRTSPPTITRVNDCNNLNSGGVQTITLTGKTYCESVTYSETRKKLYFLLVNEILELDPETMAYTIFPISMSDGTGGSGAITTDGTYFYVVSYVLHSKVAKFSFDGSSFTKIGEASILYSTLQLGWGHSAEYDADSGYLYIAGADSPGWIAKVNTSTLSYSLIRLAGGYEKISDDIAVAPDYVYAVLEGPTQYRILKVKKSDWTYSYIDPQISATGFGCIYNHYDDCIYVVYDTTPGSYIKINQKTGEMGYHVCPSGINSLNELQFDEYRMFYTTWTSPAKIIRTVDVNEQYFRILKSDNSVGLSYNEGAVSADSFSGDGSGLTNIPVGNDGNIQFKNGSNFGSNSLLFYEETSNSSSLGDMMLLNLGNKIGVFI